MAVAPVASNNQFGNPTVSQTPTPGGSVPTPTRPSSGSSGGFWLAVIILIALLAMGPVFFLIGSLRGIGPNPGGAQLSTQGIDTSPTSPLVGDLGDLARFTNTQAYLSTNDTFISDIENRLHSLAQHLTDKDPAFKDVPADSITKIQAIIPEMLAQLTNIRIAVTSSNTAEATKQAEAFQANVERLNRLAYVGGGNIVEIARRIVDANNNGKGPIKYTTGISTAESGGYPVGMDCSGFVSYVLQKAGVFKLSQKPVVADFYNQTKSGALKGFTMVVDNDGTKLSFDSFEKLIADGTIQPGDLILRANDSLDGRDGQGAAGGFQPHILIFLGTANPNEVAAQSTTRSGRQGPMYETMNDIKARNTLRAVIRPPKPGS